MTDRRYDCPKSIQRMLVSRRAEEIVRSHRLLHLLQAKGRIQFSTCSDSTLRGFAGEKGLDRKPAASQ
jgi:hypothetical protein